MDEQMRTPRQMVTGVLDDPDQLERTLAALRDAGFPDDAVRASGGEQALARVDPEGRRHGLRGRLIRSLEHFGQEGEEHRAAAQEVEAGHLLLVISVADEAERDRAVSTLRAQGLRRLRYWGQWGIEHLS